MSAATPRLTGHLRQVFLRWEGGHKMFDDLFAELSGVQSPKVAPNPPEAKTVNSEKQGRAPGLEPGTS